MAQHPNLKQTHNLKATVISCEALTSLDSTITRIIIDNYVSESDFTSLDLSQLSMLELLVVGNHCFSYVDDVKLIGLNKLESVVVGENSFTKFKEYYSYNPDRHFHLKNCPSLRRLTIGNCSFSDYSVCEIESVDALTVIETGRVSFAYASLELKSIFIQIE